MKKVAIVGYAPSRDMAPFNEEGWEIWGLNDLYQHIPKYDRWFQIHTANEVQRRFLELPETRDSWDKHVEKLKTMQCPIYMQFTHPGIPNSVAYPLETMYEHFGQCFVNPDHAKYFTNSISFMLALAIYEGYDEIHVYGVDMATANWDGEYAHQRPSCEFWLGVAAGRGIKIFIPDQSDLLKTRFLYGYEDEKQHVFETKVAGLRDDLKAKKAQAIEQQKRWREHEMQYAGADMALSEIMMTWQ